MIKVYRNYSIKTMKNKEKLKELEEEKLKYEDILKNIKKTNQQQLNESGADQIAINDSINRKQLLKRLRLLLILSSIILNFNLSFIKSI